uniref:GLOBIN domain-containing protein n=1 Tax=Rhabditophanes sp. KR3021 TaxID=114890 RepID=A0AC35U1S3_9BILA
MLSSECPFDPLYVKKNAVIKRYKTKPEASTKVDSTAHLSPSAQKRNRISHQSSLSFYNINNPDNTSGNSYLGNCLNIKQLSVSATPSPACSRPSSPPLNSPINVSSSTNYPLSPKQQHNLYSTKYSPSNLLLKTYITRSNPDDIAKRQSIKGPSCEQTYYHNYSNTLDVPFIHINQNSNNNCRRTSLSTNLRFQRTLSSDSIDSLERQCLINLRMERLLMNQYTDKNNMGEETSSSTAPSYIPSSHIPLRAVGRSRTDPGNDEDLIPPPISSPTTHLPVGENKSKPDKSIAGELNFKALSEVIGLSNYQQKLILQCWPNIYTTGNSSTFATNIYPNLCTRNQKAKALLQKADGVAVFSQSEIDCTSMHSKLTLEIIDSVVRNFDSNPISLIGYLNEIGHAHRSLKSIGMPSSMWDDLGDSILEGVRRNDLVRKHKELRRAWLAIIAFLTDNLKQGQNSFRVSPSTETPLPNPHSSSSSSQQQ